MFTDKLIVELSILLPEVVGYLKSGRNSDVESLLEERIRHTRHFLDQLIRGPSMSLEDSVLRWVENETLEIRECAINLCIQLEGEIANMTETTRESTCAVLQECINLGIQLQAPVSLSSLCPSLQPPQSTRLENSMHIKRVEEWRLAKARKKAEEEARELASRKCMQETQKRIDQERRARKHIIDEYKAQKQEEVESETRSAVQSHLAEIKLRREQYLSLGVGERNREKEAKFLDRKRIKLKPTRLVVCPKPSSCKPSKLYHPTKSSLYRSDCRSTPVLSETASTSAPLFTPYLSRYSMTQV